jgi:hypothetical protein
MKTTLPSLPDVAPWTAGERSGPRRVSDRELPEAATASPAAPSSATAASGLRDALVRAIDREREALGLPPYRAPEQATSTESAYTSDSVLQMMERRISTAKLSPEQRDLLRRFVALSLRESKSPKDFTRLVNGAMALVEAWETVHRGKRVAPEPPEGVKRISDYLREFDEADRAAGEIQQALSSAPPEGAAAAAGAGAGGARAEAVSSSAAAPEAGRLLHIVA